MGLDVLDFLSLFRWLAEFFYHHCVKEQLREVPQGDEPAYYDNSLQQLVYHQLRSPMCNVTYIHTLRNIYFVRERIARGQRYVGFSLPDALNRYPSLV